MTEPQIVNPLEQNKASKMADGGPTNQNALWATMAAAYYFALTHSIGRTVLYTKRGLAIEIGAFSWRCGTAELG